MLWKAHWSHTSFLAFWGLPHSSSQKGYSSSSIYTHSTYSACSQHTHSWHWFVPLPKFSSGTDKAAASGDGDAMLGAWQNRERASSYQHFLLLFKWKYQRPWVWFPVTPTSNCPTVPLKPMSYPRSPSRIFLNNKAGYYKDQILITCSYLIKVTTFVL